jgi:hypothetical protein
MLMLPPFLSSRGTGQLPPARRVLGFPARHAPKPLSRRALALVCSCLLLSGACSSAAVGGKETLSQADKAFALQLETSLRDASVAEETYRSTNGTYTTDVGALQSEGMNTPPDVTLAIKTADASAYCIEATQVRLPGVTWHVATGGSPTTGLC